MKKNAKEGMIALAVMIVISLGIIWLLYGNERENNKHINPTIFPAFRAIESKCLSESFPHETVRCQKVLKLLGQCASEAGCTANEYYEELTRAGFTLPSFYEPGYVPK